MTAFKKNARKGMRNHTNVLSERAQLRMLCANMARNRNRIFFSFFCKPRINLFQTQQFEIKLF